MEPDKEDQEHLLPDEAIYISNMHLYKQRLNELDSDCIVIHDTLPDRLRIY